MGFIFLTQGPASDVPNSIKSKESMTALNTRPALNTSPCFAVPFGTGRFSWRLLIVFNISFIFTPSEFCRRRLGFSELRPVIGNCDDCFLWI